MWIQTYTGKEFFPTAPSRELINIIDIAHALSNICRFTGHTRDFYSVAQHSVLVSNYVPAGYELAGLLHDATEAYLNDIAAPLKRTPELYGYTVAEQRLARTIEARFGLEPDSLSGFAVKAVDIQMLYTEKRDLLTKQLDWGSSVGPFEEKIIPWTPKEARSKFLARFADLTPTGPDRKEAIQFLIDEVQILPGKRTETLC